MRLLFSRLRRGVAMFIYPEMGVEARVKAARGLKSAGTREAGNRVMGVAEIEAAIAQIYAAADPWSEFVFWLSERQALNRSLGGQDHRFISLLVMQTATVRLPITAGGQK